MLKVISDKAFVSRDPPSNIINSNIAEHYAKPEIKEWFGNNLGKLSYITKTFYSLRNEPTNTTTHPIQKYSFFGLFLKSILITATVKLGQVVSDEGAKFDYIYDYPEPFDLDEINQKLRKAGKLTIYRIRNSCLIQSHTSELQTQWQSA